MNEQIFTDSIEAVQTVEPQDMLSTINLEGNLHELVISVGFLGKPNTYNYPYFTNDDPSHPWVGIYEDGTLLKDSVITTIISH